MLEAGSVQLVGLRQGLQGRGILAGAILGCPERVEEVAPLPTGVARVRVVVLPFIPT